MTQEVHLAGAIIVSTPQKVALADATKGLNMFKKVNIPIVGMIENMSYFQTPNGDRFEIFDYGGVKKEAYKNNIKFLGEIPIDIEVRKNSDNGIPICIDNPQNTVSQIYNTIAKTVINITDQKSP